MFKQLVKENMPIFLIKAIKKIRKSKDVFYTDYQAAAKACLGKGYQDAELVKVVVQKSILFQKELAKNNKLNLGALRTAIALAASGSTSLRVIDFGGAGGYHYFLARKILDPSISLDWRVVETEAMAEAGNASLRNQELKFFSKVQDAVSNELDLVFSSSALQYCPNPYSVLEELVSLNAKYFFLTRTPFHDGDIDLVSLQRSKLSSNGPGLLPEGFKDASALYPITFMRKNEVERIINRKFDIRFCLQEDDIGFSAGSNPLIMTGYFGVSKAKT